ncbi:MAG TPA: helix-turn-helix domain-containing protein [Candidatus Blautia intestinipullorum]|nr:helix-turn-helix domain-containing protein [Candidatus Blautia intestinipullorum]
MYEGIYQSKEEKQESLRSIGNRICFFRKNTGMTQAQLASLVDIDYRTLSRYENGNSEMGVNLLFKIAAALHVSVDDLAPEWMGREDAQTDEILGMFVGMSADQRVKILEYAEFLLMKRTGEENAPVLYRGM